MATDADPISLHGSKCIHLLEWFDFRNHICIVTELLGLCIYDFLKENDFQPFPRRHIQDFARQLLTSVACKPRAPDRSELRIAKHSLWLLVLHDLTLIHTDLKPENILLVDHQHRTVSVPAPAGSRVRAFSIVFTERMMADRPHSPVTYNTA